MNDIMLEVRDLTKHFPVSGSKRQVVHAVDGVSFQVPRGKTLGLVGESGCGKSSCARTIIRIYDPTSGQIILDGQDITHLTQRQLIPLRRNIQMIFQDPYASLNARMTVRDIIEEPLRAHKVCATAREADELIYEMLDRVGLSKEHANRYAHEFSGGQRQRVGIARALILHPKVVICDEPISALDVSIQAQVVNLLKQFQEEQGLTYLFIAHDLAMVKHISDRIAVMYLGTVVELTRSERLYEKPLHPYTQALLSSIPIPKVNLKRERIILEGDVPSPVNPPAGCRFAGRCRHAMPICKEVCPELKQCGNSQVACHLYDEK